MDWVIAANSTNNRQEALIFVSMNYFQQLLHVLEMERQQDRASYSEITEKISIQARRDNGQSWYPVVIKNTEVGYGDYLVVDVERTTHLSIPHQFRCGASVALFSNHAPTTDRIAGQLSYVSEQKLRITFPTEDLPDWAQQGKLGVDLLFDEYSYEEMKRALVQASKQVETHKTSSLMRVLLGEKQPDFAPSTPLTNVHTGALTELNPSQQKAVQHMLSAAQLSIVHGPPGTGKTTTLVRAIQLLLQQDPQQILVVAPSNTAVDLLTEKIAEQGIRVVRIGNSVRVSERLFSLTLDQQLASHTQMKELRMRRKQANQFREMALKYKKHFGRAEREQRKALLNEARLLMREAEAIEKNLSRFILDHAQVITATLVGSNHHSIANRSFKTLIIDEAGQALEPACWIPIGKTQKVIFAGDHLQLPPTVKSIEAAREGLTQTLMEKCMQYFPAAVSTLEEQYRMHAQIMSFPSQALYQGLLQAHPSVAHRALFPEDDALLFIDTAGCSFEEQVVDTRISNPDEAAFLLRYLSDYLNMHEGKLNTSEPAAPDIAIISPYKEQVITLKELLMEISLPIAQQHLHIQTIDAFQGQERDLVLISLTRSNQAQQIGFLSDIRRMNVAMTRAKKKLVIIGDSSTWGTYPFYADFIRYAEQIGAYHSAWEFIHS